MELLWMFVLLGGPGLVLAALLALATQRWLLTAVVGAAGFIAYNVFLATADHSDPYGVCGECDSYLGNEVPILLPIMGFSNGIAWVVGMALVWTIVQARRLRAGATPTARAPARQTLRPR